MHIFIANAHWNNRGDEAAHRAFWESILELYPDCRLTIMFKDRKPITWFPKQKNVQFFSCQFTAPLWDIWLTVLSRGICGRDANLKMAVKRMKSADCVVYSPGGSVINDRFYWSKQLEYLVPFFCAKIFRTPMFVAAPSMGPFHGHRWLRKWLLKTPQTLCVRESISKDYLDQIGIHKTVHVTQDLAFLNDIDVEANAAALKGNTELNQFLGTYKKVVGITLSDFKWHVKHGKNPELLKRIDNSFSAFIRDLAKRGYGVLLIPQLFGNQDDTHLLNKYVYGQHTQVMSNHFDSAFQQYIISKLFAVVGVRYHGNIFAAKMGTPFIPISYEEKMTGYLDSSGYSDFSILLEDISFDRIRKKFAELEVQHDDLQTRLINDRESWRKAAFSTIELFRSFCLQWVTTPAKS